MTEDLDHERKLLAEEWHDIAERILLEANVLLEHEARELGAPSQSPKAMRARLTAAVARWLDEQKRGYRR